ncbi:MAG: SIS domain-containing protein [Candidatus Competibacteraceae bacterium]|nr:SIS domain-containing protein [Candidatus Competibacteraceae bacterium]
MQIQQSYIQLLKETLDSLDSNQVGQAIQAFFRVHNEDATIYIFGNGGSGATASHAAGDFLKGASYGLKKRFKVICLNDNIPSMMAIANDIGWDDIFIEPLKNFLHPHDLVIGISGSGNSRNVVKGLQYAKDLGVQTIAFCGYKGGEISRMADIVIHAKAMDMEIAEDVHMVVFNIIKKEMMNHLHQSSSMGEQYDQRIQ